MVHTVEVIANVCTVHKFTVACKVKFIYSEKATNFCEISNVDLSYIVTVKFTMEIPQNFVAFSEYMNFKRQTKYPAYTFNVYSGPHHFSSH